ncbi:uncharacterized protein LOC135194629 [Vanessa tameamea]|uniref:Uncharacterized protein LOC135194629 n=1 Tax=Vanessa tameamea TaxID=334116 RepID=A0ABM4AYB9_VANTA
MGRKRKLQEVAEKSRPKRRRILSSSSDSSLDESPNRNTIATVSSPRSSVYRMGHDMAQVMPIVSPLPATPPAVMTPQRSADAEELDSDILELLGDALKPNTCFGKSMHKDVADRWQDILGKGLPKETKEKLLSEYMVPDNCKMLVAPILNPEAKAALTDATVKRDHALLDKQKQVGVALSALSQAIDEIISIANKEHKLKILKPISDACRILCEVHNSDTKLRRNFVISAVNSSLKDTLMETGRDDYLFGTNLAERLKTAKTIQ